MVSRIIELIICSQMDQNVDNNMKTAVGNPIPKTSERYTRLVQETRRSTKEVVRESCTLHPLLAQSESVSQPYEEQADCCWKQYTSREPRKPASTIILRHVPHTSMPGRLMCGPLDPPCPPASMHDATVVETTVPYSTVAQSTGSVAFQQTRGCMARIHRTMTWDLVASAS